MTQPHALETHDADAIIGRPVQLIDMVFPGDTNHHGTLFGGVALAHMDKIAFLAAARHARAPFVTACSDRIDFEAPGRVGEIVEATGRVVRVGNRSVDVEVELIAEALITGERRRCTRGKFTLVAEKGPDTRLPFPPLPEGAAQGIVPRGDGKLHMVDMVFPMQTNHYGTLFGGDALKMMGRAAFICATRHSRKAMIMGTSDRIDFKSPIREGEMIEMIPQVLMAGGDSVLVGVELWAENLLTGERRHSATAKITMVTVQP
jgi:acyl-CoA hydrolase